MRILISLFILVAACGGPIDESDPPIHPTAHAFYVYEPVEDELCLGIVCASDEMCYAGSCFRFCLEND